MGEWLVKLKGHEFDLDILSQKFNSSKIKVVKNEKGYFLKSSTFDSLDDPKDIGNCAEKLINRMNGYMTIKHDYEMVDIGGVIKKEGDKRRVFASTSIQAQTRISNVTLTVAGEEENIDYSDIIDKSKNKQSLRKVLRLMGKDETSWVTLYKIFEIVRSEVGNEISNWVSESKMTLFKRTANHPEAIGDKARHGNNNVEPPSDPMELGQAKKLIFKIVNNWIDSINESNG